MIGYKLTRPNENLLDGCSTPHPSASFNVVKVELQTHFDGDCEHEPLLIEPCEITQEEIDNMPEFPGW
jgi:hypothetical protein